MRKVKTFKSKYKLMLKQRMEAMENEDVRSENFPISVIYPEFPLMSRAERMREIYDAFHKLNNKHLLLENE